VRSGRGTVVLPRREAYGGTRLLHVPKTIHAIRNVDNGCGDPRQKPNGVRKSVQPRIWHATSLTVGSTSFHGRIGTPSTDPLMPLDYSVTFRALDNDSGTSFPLVRIGK
jgi:hypothetical protein